MDIPFRQIGALPYRLSSTGEIEILLVTSRGTAQWIIPKGWPMEGLSDPDAAAREAYEEAGLMGEMDPNPVGNFGFEKQAKGMDTLSPFVVEVYLMRVDRQLAFWPEATQRQTAWMSPELAGTMISNKSLSALITLWAAAHRG